MRAPADDAALARLAIQGDTRAFGELVRRHEAGLAQAARSFGIPETDVDDVVQETCLTAWRHLADYDPTRPFRAWLFRIALNKMRDLYRFRKVRDFLFGAFGLDKAEAASLRDRAPSPEQRAETLAELAEVRVVLQRLDRDMREALVLTAIVGLSQAEAAEALQTTPKGVEGRVTRARAKLAALLKERGSEPP
ncbi:MAG TPA: sigma-70 family RNA polymerase sigma factor [Dyella sp.]|uniref:RNA polymerase sigma factor n=1 Tax=Dyella sp. TaxID=1869338 RepID=UPI002F920EFF